MTLLSKTSCFLLLAMGVVQAEAGTVAPFGGVPLVRGMVWTGAGIGATASGGATIAEGVEPLTGMDGVGWYHYKPWLIAGVGFNLAMTTDAQKASVFVSRYELHSTMVWPIGTVGAYQLSVPTCFGKKDFYLDTLAGADPVLQSESYLGSGLLAAVGMRKRALGMSVSGGYRWAWWRGLTRPNNIDVVWEVEPRISFGLQSVWPRSDSLTKAWDLFLTFPFEHAVRRVDVNQVAGRVYDGSTWKVGVRFGLAVVL